MKQLFIKPQIYKFDKFQEFAKEFAVGKGDLIFTHKFIYEPVMKQLNLECDFEFQEQYGMGEPSNTIIDQVFNVVGQKNYKRIIAVGGGSVIDIAKLLVLKDAKKTIDLFEKRVPLIKDKELIIIPTTCGTGSEVTNVSIAEIKEKKTKMGLAIDELYADYAVLIPELVKSLPYKFFVFSSVDALIHVVESFVSPKSNSFTELFSVDAMNKIIKGYLAILEKGQDYRFEILDDFVVASTYAGIAFGNTGVGAVHALSYPLGGGYHVPHGEANYQFFIEVFKTYNRLKPDGKIRKLNKILATVLNSKDENDVYNDLEKVLSGLITRKALREYGMKEEEIELFTDSVIETQQRLLVNNYTFLSRDDIMGIYRRLY